MDSLKSPNARVQSTTHEAASSKLSAVNLGYYSDPFLKYFVKRIEKRSPLINRGYYARVAAMRQYIELFFKSLKEEEPVQIVNIGAGLDTTFFWISEQRNNATYYEMDFHELLQEKANIINRVDELRSFLKGVDHQGDVEMKPDVDANLINCGNYKMLSLDLNNSNLLEKHLTSCGFDFSIPTLFICECVLIYLEITSSDNLIKTLAGLMRNTSCILVYEQVNPNTAFGKVMISNFSQRGIELKSIFKYDNLEKQFCRFKNLGWSHVYISDMNEIYDYHLNTEEKKKIEKIEMFDEFEEWRLLQNHYFILVAFSPSQNLNTNDLYVFLKNKKYGSGESSPNV
ncbi:leucine carboxyl methyltransferase, putative [Plasmodium knowlesi strain H]|uniref:Leucine carboxyl methyltransferase 1 n=3 Tax=Plasmodium knowlesi TaxID=5850 RepID=A0A5K1U8V7_PLAKH|nr:leucine carboxyl methyltransferase, putative [Plasmodium knowlesi strain H]OTN65706.1 putative Leucine carboxyl methyltransferase [Plasmodium knowlesi]CAA9989753.1 leucine carboxyl methyltransferase, putative [Plasmodium knowlesi strain H]SBO22913.1 leucine carboxyl methyltransferase, putative [Plasmodium knowlesi strain H]SBO22988.1 leucine carboxyl methyltransferase, putative [Plasmodium knowlesi strain H]VVS79227.1 leucine carboxyl methyltransferase, putative [Plasmodium knowlesi strain |eukprot:XP_002260476.1 Leucine carboxyy methytransferase, putative [Plasmodium knowlesi strain H]